jgi:Protein of unknown function (DUF998)
VPLRAAAICGLLAPVTFVAGLLLGDVAQPDGFSPANDNISDIGAQTADQAWLYNQIAANLNGLLIVAFALGLWRALGSGWLARLGVLGLAVLGVTRFLEGFLRLDCRGMDDGCENTSWQSRVSSPRSPDPSAIRRPSDPPHVEVHGAAPFATSRTDRSALLGVVLAGTGWRSQNRWDILE